MTRVWTFIRLVLLLSIAQTVYGAATQTDEHKENTMNVKEVVPFYAVTDMQKSIAFYVDGLGFEIKNKWVDEGVFRWCRLQLGGAGLMLQQYRTEGIDARQFSSNKGEGVELFFWCEDALVIYRDARERGLDASEPRVGNGNWVTRLTDPDGYRISFQSSTDVPEDTKLSDTDQ